MSAGNRQNDTPIGGIDEFRGNMLSGDFTVDDVPIFDGEKFVAGSPTGLARALGGLYISGPQLEVADDSLIAGWTAAMPSAPVNTTPNPTTGIITVNVTGVYEIAFSIDADNLVHNTTYIFEPVINGVPAAIRAIIVGSNQVFSQSTSFIMMGNASAGDTIGINSSSTGNDAYNIQNCQLSVRRI